MLDEVGLVHMNGRIYDPLIGRFMQADPIIQEPYLSQSYNRYSYVLNNPLSFTDPSGFSWWTKWRRPIMALVAMIVVPQLAMEAMQLAAAEGSAWAFNMLSNSASFGSSASVANVASAMAGGFAAGGVSGGNLQSSIIGAFTALASFGVGEAFNAHGGTSHLTTGMKAGHAAAHAAVGCASAAMAGGNCKAGAMAAGFSALAGPTVQSMVGDSFEGNLLGRMAVGGVASKLGGGEFASGALSAAFEYLYNECGATRMCGRDGAYGRSSYEINLNETGQGTGIFRTTVVDLGGVEREVGATTLRTDHPRCAARGGCPEVANGAHAFKMQTQTGNDFIRKFVPLPRLVDDAVMNGPNQLYGGKNIARGVWLHPWANPSSSNPNGRTGSEGCITCSLQTIRNIQAIIPVGASGTLNVRRFSQ